MTTKFGAWLQLYRSTSSLSWRQLAERIGMSHAHAHHLGSGKKMATLDNAIDIANALGEPVRYLAELQIQDQLDQHRLGLFAHVKYTKEKT